MTERSELPFEGVERGLLYIDELLRILEEAEKDNRAKRELLNEKIQELREKAAEIAHLESLLEQRTRELSQQIENYEKSMSWRLTAPLRYIHSKVFLTERRSNHKEKETEPRYHESGDHTCGVEAGNVTAQEPMTGQEHENLKMPGKKGLLSQRWYRFFKREVLIEKLKNQSFYAYQPLKIGVTVTEDNQTTPAGDYYTAKGLGKELKRLGYTLLYLPRIPEEQWYTVPADTDILLVLLDNYDLRMIPGYQRLFKVAWIRNWLDRWIEHEWFNDYDLILTTSQEARRIIKERTGRDSEIFMIGADTDLFRPVPSQERYASDIVFTGSYWNAPREIVDALTVEPGWTCSVYGRNWDSIESMRKYWKGFINYTELPAVYSSSKIVLDDHNHVTKPYGLVNSRVFEAMACGACVVTNAVKDIETIFPEGTISVYHSGEELTGIIKGLLSDDEKRRRAGQMAREIILQQHTYKKRAEQLIELLLKAIADEYRD